MLGKQKKNKPLHYQVRLSIRSPQLIIYLLVKMYMFKKNVTCGFINTFTLSYNDIVFLCKANSIISSSPSQVKRSISSVFFKNVLPALYYKNNA